MYRLLILLFTGFFLSGCLATKAVTTTAKVATKATVMTVSTTTKVAAGTVDLVTPDGQKDEEKKDDKDDKDRGADD